MAVQAGPDRGPRCSSLSSLDGGLLRLLNFMFKLPALALELLLRHCQTVTQRHNRLGVTLEGGLALTANSGLA